MIRRLAGFRRGNLVKRFVRIVAISLASLLIFAVAAVLVFTLALGYRFDRQNRQLVQSITDKLAPVVVKSSLV
jgi:hypothetical protein